MAKRADDISSLSGHLICFLIVSCIFVVSRLTYHLHTGRVDKIREKLNMDVEVIATSEVGGIRSKESKHTTKQPKTPKS